MITTGDIANIIYRDCEVFGITRVPDGETVVGELTDERIVIHTKELQEGTYWWKSYVEVNFCIPDYKDKSNKKRLDELQSNAHELWQNRTVTGVYNDCRYRYSLFTSSQLEESTLKCHYVNVRLLFEVLNVK